MLIRESIKDSIDISHTQRRISRILLFFSLVIAKVELLRFVLQLFFDISNRDPEIINLAATTFYLCASLVLYKMIINEVLNISKKDSGYNDAQTLTPECIPTYMLNTLAMQILHDILTPLTIIKMNTELMTVSQPKYYETSQSRIYSIINAASQIERIINSSKELILKSSSKFNVNFIACKAIDSLRDQIEFSQIEIRNNISSDITLLGPINSFERVLINLLLNSIQALRNKQGSRVISLSDKKSDSSILIIIEDNGVGIKPSELQSVYAPGFTTKSHSENLGIGLSFVRNVIQDRFSGRVEIESIENKYTKIILSIPNI